MFKITLLSIFLTITGIQCEKFRFDNYTLYKLLPRSLEQIKFLQDVQDSDLRFDFWSDPVPSADFVNVLSSPNDKSDLETLMKLVNIDYEISMDNIQEAIDKENVRSYTRNDIRSMRWDAFYTQDAINDWIDDLQTAFPDLVTVLIGGTSFEGRNIKGLKISHGEGKRVIFLEGGIHSREWISPATVTYIVNELLTSDDEEIKAMATEFDWYIFPVTNPDGYIWSHESFRMWRKNRRPVGTDFGIDLNRNWNSNWLEHGSSANPASDSYAGLGPFSEPETRTLSEFIESIGDRIDLYISFHSYSQLLLLPFGNTTEPIGNYHDAMKIGRRAMGALSVRYGTQYVTGNIAEAIYHATGGSVDWVKEHLNVPLVYCYELRDRGSYGFLMPTEEIMPNNLEVMDSLVEIVLQAKRFGYMNNSAELRCSFVLMLAILICSVLNNFNE